MKTNVLIAASVVLLGFFSQGRGGEHAPKDAFVGGSGHPYYGSGDPWNLRFFGDIDKNGKLMLCGGDLRLYGRRGQRQMLDILEGRVDDAVNYCAELLASDAKDAESLFTLTVARCVLLRSPYGQKDYAGAAESMKKAVEAGLPFERFLAGPRQIFKPLRDTDQFRRLAARYRVQLIHGPLLGCLTDTSAKFWVRTVDEVPVQVVVSTSKDLSGPIKSTIASTSSKRDWTAVVGVKGLQPDTLYYYDVILNDKSALSPELPSFRTYTASKAKFQVGFGGGALYCPANERMWDTIGSHNPAALLLLGDNVYIDLPQQLGEFHKYTYYRRQSRPEFRRLTRSVPVFAIWDDHDCGTDDIRMGPYRDKPAWKMSMLEGFRMNWNNPGYGNEQWPGCWFRFSIADVDFFMLDGRFYRTNPLASICCGK